MKSAILIIDDDDAVRELVARMVRRWGYEVHTAATGEEGLTLLREEPVDLVLSDLRMPGLDGEQVLVKVKEKNPSIPVIIFTAHGSVKSAVSAMSKGAFDYVLKPVDQEELQITVERALEMSRLRRENEFLREEVLKPGTFMIAESPAMKRLVQLMKRVAASDSTVLLTGETGSGKEVAAKFIHLNSSRAGSPFIAFNCAALNANLLESELFGHEKGAFTGASATRRGRFELADGGTILLDEIGEVPLDFQVKLLRVLQEREFERVGGTRPIKVDIRILASTNRDLEEGVRAGSFREDLLYRLKVVPLEVPPLRERREDILPLALHFMKMYAQQYGVQLSGLSPAAADYLLDNEWRGNVRELQHAVERAVVLSTGGELAEDDFRAFQDGTESEAPRGKSLQSVLDAQASAYIRQVLAGTGGQKQKAAEILEIDRVTLYRMIRKFGIEDPRP